MAGLAMKQEDVIRMAYEAGIIPWCQMHWSANQFVTIDEGMDGDLTCLMQFAALIAAAEREACAKAVAIFDKTFQTGGGIAGSIRARGEK